MNTTATSLHHEHQRLERQIVQAEVQLEAANERLATSQARRLEVHGNSRVAVKAFTQIMPKSKTSMING